MKARNTPTIWFVNVHVSGAREYSSFEHFQSHTFIAITPMSTLIRSDDISFWSHLWAENICFKIISIK